MIKDLLGHLLDTLKALFSKPETWAIIMIMMVAGAGLFLPKLEIIPSILKFIKLTWWFWLFFLLYNFFEHLWLFWRQMIFQKRIVWEMLEIIVPRENEKTPKAMEQVFRSIHSLRNAPADIQEKYWDGEVPRWFSLEIVSFGGEIKFFIRYYIKSRNLVEAAFYSQYPNIELRDAEDYTKNFPKNSNEAEEMGLKIWGVEYDLAKEEIYPIVSYVNLMSDIEPERNVDPIGTLIENLSKARPGEIIALQLLISPQDNAVWRKKWEPFMNELKEKTAKRAATVEDEEDTKGNIARTPGEIELLRDLDNNLNKPSFETTIRVIYLAPKEIFFDTYPRRGVLGALNQYASLGRNYFKMNVKTMTKTKVIYKPYVYPKLRAYYKQERLLLNFMTREMPQVLRIGKLITSHPMGWNIFSKMFHLNVESLATLFHPPSSIVLTAPHLKRAESKKAGPPVGLPIFGEEDNIEKYK